MNAIYRATPSPYSSFNQTPLAQDTLFQILGIKPPTIMHSGLKGAVPLAMTNPLASKNVYITDEGTWRNRKGTTPAPEDRIDNIMTHEFAHLAEMQKSPKFQELVDSIRKLPNSTSDTHPGPVSTMHKSEQIAYSFANALMWLRNKGTSTQLDSLDTVVPGTKFAADFIQRGLNNGNLHSR